MNRFAITAAMILSIAGFSIRAQAQVDVTGQIRDLDNRETLPFCHISVYNPLDSLLTGGISDDNGFFRIPLRPGPHRFIVTAVGYESDTMKVDVGNESKYLGIIRLKSRPTDLGEVVVKGATRGYTIDKDIQLVTSKMREGTTNTLEVLERINGLSYDRYNRTIKVDGDTRVIMLVNGLEKNQEYIRNLAPDRIREVEVIRNPGGRYALEGYSAVINIILKSDYRGTDLMILENGLADLDTKVNRPFPINYTAVTWNYTYDKINFYLKGNNTFNRFLINGKSEQDYSSGLGLKYRPLDGKQNLAVNNINSSYTAGLDYYLNPRHTLSFESTVNAFPARQSTDLSYDVSRYMNDSLVDQYTSRTTNHADTRDITNSLFYIFNINDGTKLNAEFTYDRYDDHYTNSLIQGNGFERIEIGTNQKDYTKFYVELSHNLNERSTLLAGYGNTWRRLQNDYTTGTQLLPGEGIIDDTARFGMKELRHKLYAYYSLSMTRQLSFKVGAAAEYSHPWTEEADHTYMIYQPYLDFNISTGKILDIKLKYRAESNYPDIRQVTPFRQVIDPYTFEQGNPELRPELTHTVSTRFLFLHGLFSLEPYFGFSNNRINRVASPLDVNVFQFTYENVGHFASKGVKGNFTLPLFKQSLIIKSDFNFFNNSITYQDRKNVVSDWTMNNQLIYIGKKHHTVTGIIYQKALVKMINAQGYDYGNNDYWLFIVQQPFLKNRLNVMLGYILPVNLAASYTQGNYINTGYYTSSSQYDISMLKNFLLVNVTWRFNQGKSVKNIEKEVEKEVERQGRKIF
jgi:hypothetical protein